MKNNLNILLVEPSNKNIFTGGHASLPLWPCVLSTLTPKNHRIEFIHSSFETVTEKKLSAYDLVGITCRTDTANYTYQIGDTCKKLNIPCVIGGIHAFFLTDEVKEHCDSVVLGEAECLWQTILEDVCRGTLQRVYQCTHREPHDLPVADLSIVRKYKFRIQNVTETVRGCPYHCSFCSATLYNGRKYKYKPIAHIIKEIDSWENKSSLSLFADLNIVTNFDKAKELFRALIPYKLMWWGNASVDLAKDDELLQLMKESGCSYLGIGMESTSEDTLKEIHKVNNIKHDFKEVVRRLHEYNIDVYGFFIFGMDTDEKDVFKRTAEYAIEANVDFPIFQILVPYPGTKIFSNMEKEGRLFTKDWSNYTRSDVVFRPKNMTRKELIKGTLNAYEIAYSKKAMAKRYFSRWRGIKRHAYNLAMISHFAKQVGIIRRSHNSVLTN